jgi:NADH-quinone oxidoreductase subunit L
MAIFIIILPLVASIITGLFSGKMSAKLVCLITSVSMIVTAILAIVNFNHVVIDGNAHNIHLFNWINIGAFSVNWGMDLDSLSSVMLVVVTIVSCLVHLYSIGYMNHDPNVSRFMSYLSLFTFFMIMLVASDNFLQLFLGWEGVGLCSYLLIGFWYRKESANKAAMKAFIINRIGDFGFALGIFTIFSVFNSLEFGFIFSQVAAKQSLMINFLGWQVPAFDLICLLLFMGSMGKSAQIGLHTWLPDAMEGPTPVSALIHAATMVTAGVFLVARCSPLFEYSELARDVVTIVGAVTCAFAATIALTQNDIKKIIAYSTCSQLGYMFFACGVSAYDAGIFHLMTHAFFKALLFLGAGSVIHAMSGEQDINKMGGIARKIPFTYLMMWIGSLAIAGIFPFAGYYSKDIILESAYASGSNFAFWLGSFAAFCTAFYSWRLIIKCFHGRARANDEVMHHVHESPLSMTIPLAILAIGSILAGFVASDLLHIMDEKFWNGSIVNLHPLDIESVPIWVKNLPLILGISGIICAYLTYMIFPKLSDIIACKIRPFYQLSFNKYYIDEIYDAIFVKPIMKLSRYLWQIVDVLIIDGLGPNGFAFMARHFGVIVNKSQTGYIYHYLLAMLAGVTIIISFLLIKS